MSFLVLLMVIASCGWIGNALGAGVVTNPLFFFMLVGALIAKRLGVLK